MSVSAELVDDLQDLTIEDQSVMLENCTVASEEINKSECDTNIIDINNHHGLCAICLNKIVLQETALVKGCEHAYCVTCILRWASCKNEPTCPQCKNPFNFLNIHRALDGSIHDYMFEESVCLLLRASWFIPLDVVVETYEAEFEIADYYDEYINEVYLNDEYEDDDLNEAYLSGSTSLRIGNRRWGDNGYVRSGRQEARPAHRPNSMESDAGPSHQSKKKGNVSKEVVGRRAKRALKREAADKAAATKSSSSATFGEVK